MLSNLELGQLRHRARLSTPVPIVDPKAVVNSLLDDIRDYRHQITALRQDNEAYAWLREVMNYRPVEHHPYAQAGYGLRRVAYDRATEELDNMRTAAMAAAGIQHGA